MSSIPNISDIPLIQISAYPEAVNSKRLREGQEQVVYSAIRAAGSFSPVPFSIAPEGFDQALALSNVTASNLSIPQLPVSQMQVAMQEHSELEGAVFLKNGAESAVFLKGEHVFKVPIIGLQMQSPTKRKESIAMAKTSFGDMEKTFVKLGVKCISLAQTEFGDLIKQPFFLTELSRKHLSRDSIRDLRALIVNKVTADVRPSNFMVDDEGILRFVDWNLPCKSDALVNRKEMIRVWNTIDSSLGALVTEEDFEVFEEKLDLFFKNPGSSEKKPKINLPVCPPTPRRPTKSFGR